MMTPEQMQSTIDFILQNHANAMIRMDRFDAELREQKLRTDELVAAIRTATDHSNEVFRMITETLASQSQRLRWLEERGF